MAKTVVDVSGSRNEMAFQTVEMQHSMQGVKQGQFGVGGDGVPATKQPPLAPSAASKTVHDPTPYVDPYDETKYFGTRTVNMAGGGTDLEYHTIVPQSIPQDVNSGQFGVGDDPRETTCTAHITLTSTSTTVLYPRPSVDRYDARRYFVTRPGAFDQAMEDLKAHVTHTMGETVYSFWLLVEVDHWNNEKERVVVITDTSLLVCKYDFIMLKGLHVQRYPLNHVDRVSQGTFTFPERSLDRREGEGLRIYWDSRREASFLSRWNPWATDVPYSTFMEHPVKDSCQRLSVICELSTFAGQLVQAIQNAQRTNPVPGKIGRAVVAEESIHIGTYVGLLSYIGNRNKLGYSLARGNVGF